MKPVARITEYQSLVSLAHSLSLQKSGPKKRVQLKMPQRVVDLLDQEFPHIDRSKLLTMAALDLIIRKQRINNPELEHWVSQEQADLDRMWTYLNDRENG